MDEALGGRDGRGRRPRSRGRRRGDAADRRLARGRLIGRARRSSENRRAPIYKPAGRPAGPGAVGHLILMVPTNNSRDRGPLPRRLFGRLRRLPAPVWTLATIFGVAGVMCLFAARSEE